MGVPITAGAYVAKVTAGIAGLGKDIVQIADRHADFAAQEARRRVPVRTGALQRSIRSRVIKKGEEVTIELVAGGGEVDYARYVEEGTSRMAPRPYLRPAVDKALPSLEADIADELAKTALAE